MTRKFLLVVVLLLAGCTGFNQMQAEYIEQTGDSAMSGTGDADVVFVRAVNTGAETWTFHVSVEHPDTGWEDYADGWDVVLPDGTPILPNSADGFTRLLLHPHENEQPFTRSQSNIIIPSDITTVTVRAHDIVDGWGGQEITVNLEQAEGDNYTVETN
ncbi:MAG: hypothetical protein Phog2KO_09080 [Phototrophicaceae bacterium]